MYLQKQHQQQQQEHHQLGRPPQYQFYPAAPPSSPAAPTPVAPPVTIGAESAIAKASTAGRPLAAAGPSAASAPALLEPPAATLPVLIVPGFMSSGLEVRQSTLKPEWKGQRLWMSLAKLGLNSLHTGGGVYESFMNDVQPALAAANPVAGAPMTAPPLPDSQQDFQHTIAVASNQSAVMPPAQHVFQHAHQRSSSGLPTWHWQHPHEQEDRAALEAEEARRHLKNRWLEHLMLKGPDKEAEGMEVRAIEGMAGIDFLEPGALSHLTYVFGPVIKALQQSGYAEGKNMEAASYDWRLAPQVLNQRDKYFEEMATRIERLDEGSGVAVLGHSMGNKVVQYFLSYMKQTRGQAWLDSHVHSWIACGAPTLGAAAAARATLVGDRMGLETFLSMNEAIAMGRSFSSAPWLFPLGLHAQSSVYLRRQGMLEIRCDSADFYRSMGFDPNSAVELAVQVDWGSHVDVLRSDQSSVFDGDKAIWPKSGVVVFGAPPEMPPNANVTIFIKERKWLQDQCDCYPGVWCFLKWTLFFPITMIALAFYILRAFMFMRNIINEWCTGRGGWGIARGSTTPLSLNFLEGHRGRWITIDTPMPESPTWPCFHFCRSWWKSPGKVQLELRWRRAEDLHREYLGGPIISSPTGIADNGAMPAAVSVQHGNRSEEVYDRVSLKQMMQLEGCKQVESTWDSYYANDPLYDHTGTNDCPPIRRVVAINGVNSRSEVGLALCINNKRLDCTSDLDCRYTLDTEAVLAPGMACSTRCTIKNGIIWEEPSNSPEELPSGDGTVPIVSLRRSREWADRLDYREVNIDKAGHREMLADKRFHQAVLEALVPTA